MVWSIGYLENRVTNWRPTLYVLRCLDCLQRSVLERSLLHHHEEDRHQNQNVNCRGDDASDNGSGNRLHNVRADTGLPENRCEAGKNGDNGHQLGTETLHGSLDHRGLYVSVAVDFTFLQPILQGFMQIDHHDNARLYSDAEERNVANPNRNAEVIAQQLLEQETSCHGIDRWKDQDYGLGDRVEEHIEQHKDHEKDDWEDQLQALLGP